MTLQHIQPVAKELGRYIFEKCLFLRKNFESVSPLLESLVFYNSHYEVFFTWSETLNVLKHYNDYG